MRIAKALSFYLWILLNDEEPSPRGHHTSHSDQALLVRALQATDFRFVLQLVRSAVQSSDPSFSEPVKDALVNIHTLAEITIRTQRSHACPCLKLGRSLNAFRTRCEMRMRTLIWHWLSLTASSSRFLLSRTDEYAKSEAYRQSYAKSTRLQIQEFMYISTKSSIIEPSEESPNEPPSALSSSTAESTQHIPPDSSTTTALSLQKGSEMADICVKHRQPRLEDSSELAISILTTITQEACSEYCRCQCHARSCVGIPSWLTPILGSRLLTIESDNQACFEIFA